MLLTEVAHEARNKNLDYLEEYLIMTDSMTLTEAKGFLLLIEADEKTKLKKIKEKFEEKVDNLKKWFAKQMATIKAKYSGSTLKKKIVSLKELFKRNLEKIKNAMRSAKDSIVSRSSKMKSSVKTAWKNLPKSGKIAAGVAGAGAAGAGGYAAYKARKKRQEALG